MPSERVLGVIVLVCSLVGIAAYGLVLYTYPMVVLQLTLFVAVAGVLLIVAWIGWTMASTPSQPTPSEKSISGSNEEAEQGKPGVQPAVGETKA